MTLKQQCREKAIHWYNGKERRKIAKKHEEELTKEQFEKRDEELNKFKNHLSENFPLTQQLQIVCSYLWDFIIVIAPAVLLLLYLSTKIFCNIISNCAK